MKRGRDAVEEVVVDGAKRRCMDMRDSASSIKIEGDIFDGSIVAELESLCHDNMRVPISIEPSDCQGFIDKFHAFIETHADDIRQVVSNIKERAAKKQNGTEIRLKDTFFDGCARFINMDVWNDVRFEFEVENPDAQVEEHIAEYVEDADEARDLYVGMVSMEIRAMYHNVTVFTFSYLQEYDSEMMSSEKVTFTNVNETIECDFEGWRIDDERIRLMCNFTRNAEIAFVDTLYKMVSIVANQISVDYEDLKQSVNDMFESERKKLTSDSHESDSDDSDSE